jgi:hypothetical protein
MSSRQVSSRQGKLKRFVIVATREDQSRSWNVYDDLDFLQIKTPHEFERLSESQRNQPMDIFRRVPREFILAPNASSKKVLSIDCSVDMGGYFFNHQSGGYFFNHQSWGWSADDNMALEFVWLLKLKESKHKFTYDVKFGYFNSTSKDGNVLFHYYMIDIDELLTNLLQELDTSNLGFLPNSLLKIISLFALPLYTVSPVTALNTWQSWKPNKSMACVWEKDRDAMLDIDELGVVDLSMFK